MAAALATTARFKLTPPTPAGPGIKEIAKALKEDGSLVVEPAHLIAILLPDALEDSATAGKKVLTQHLLEYILVPSVVFSTAMRRAGMHWSLLHPPLQIQMLEQCWNVDHGFSNKSDCIGCTK